LYTDVQNCANYFVIVRIVKTLLELVEGYNVLHTITILYKLFEFFIRLYKVYNVVQSLKYL